MKIYNTNDEVKKDIKGRMLTINDSVTFYCNIDINASINAWEINALSINAGDINVENINARDISYYAFCTAYHNITCNSWKAGREIHHEPICLDGKLTIKTTTGEQR